MRSETSAVNQIIDLPLLLTKSTGTTAIPSDQVLCVSNVKQRKGGAFAREGGGKYGNEAVTVLLAQNFAVLRGVEVLLESSGFALVQADDIVLLSHFVTVNRAERGGKTAHGGDVEDGSVLDAVVWFAGEGGTHHSVDNAGAAVRFFRVSREKQEGIEGREEGIY